MAVGNKVRVYDLAKELKQDTKRIIEDLRREGADIDVPSNSVPKELADKVRNKYFPKKETAPVRAIKVIKKAAKVEEEAPAPEEAAPVEEIPEVLETPVEVVPVPQEEAPAKADKQVRKLKKPAAVKTAKKEVETVEAVGEESAEPVIPEVEEVEIPVKAPEIKTARPAGTQVKQIRISAEALKTIKDSEQAKVDARTVKPAEAAVDARGRQKRI